jgi:tRNA threonylcarbamoyladenosine modification (KEOPS) complex Cgi121 subunit
LIKWLEETEEFAQITGFKNLKIDNTKKFVKKIRDEMPQKAWIQFFDASVVATWQHLFFATLNAQLSFRNHSNISKSIEMETLLFASTQHQINKAIKKMGIKTDSINIAVVIVAKITKQLDRALSVISRIIGKEPDESVLEISDHKQEIILTIFEISRNEIEAIIKKENTRNAIRDVVLEKVALLSTKS